MSYKIISKVLANRLKRVLNVVISEEQFAFGNNRAISDNVTIGHECLHTLWNFKSGRHGFATLKLDLSKAFDRDKWIYLEKLINQARVCSSLGLSN